MRRFYVRITDLLVEAPLDVGHALEVRGDVSAVLRSVLHFVLGGQIVERVDRWVETGHGQKRSQVGRVRRDDDKTKQPPRSGYQTAG